MHAEGEPHNGPDSRDRLDSLLEGLLIEGLTSAEWEELVALVEGDRDSARRYAEAVHLREAMSDFAVGAPPVGAASFGASALSRADLAEGGVSPQAERPQAERKSTGPGWQNWLSVALAVCLALLVGGAIGVWLPDGPRGDLPLAERGGPATPQTSGLLVDSEATPKEHLGRVSGLSPEASSDGLLRSYQVGDELRRGEVVQLARGVMRVSFSAGPVAIIQGPAEFMLVADQAMFMRYGKVTSSAAGGFVVQTPLASAEARDAAFAVAAKSGRSTHVYAYRGEVAVHSNPKLVSPKRLLKSLAEGEGIELAANGEPDGLVASDALAPMGLVVSWDDVMQGLHPYERLVLSDRPLAYWPLHRVRRNRRVLDLTQNGFDGQAIGNWPVEISDSQAGAERGAYFDGESYIESDRKPSIAIRTGFSVEGWAKVEGGPAFQSIFTSRWVLDTYTPNRQCLGFTLYAGENDHWEFWTGNGRYGELWDELKAVDTPVERHSWTHVAATFEPDNAGDQPLDTAPGVVRLYVNGELVATDRHDVGLLDFEWPARIGAAEFVPNSLTAWLFRGELRDIAVYDFPLAADRVAAHYQAGKPNG